MRLNKKMVKYLKDGLLRLKFLAKILILLPGFVYMHFSRIMKALPQNTKKILFVLDDQKFYSMGDGNSRYLYMLLQRFSEAGYNVYFYKKINLKTYYRLEVLGKLIFNLKNLKILNQLPSNTSDFIFAFDRLDHSLLQKTWKKLVYINIFKPPFCQTGNRIWIPYAMFPVIYDIGKHRLLDVYRANSRKIKILFAGNTNRAYYNNPKIKNFYGQLTRVDAVNALFASNDKVKCTKGEEGFLNLMNITGYANECRILLTDASFPIQPADWLGLISKSNFFICLSGTDYPMCHNAIEAMAVGTIPIISYPDWFFPPLEHEKNAILYSGKDDLIKKVDEVLHMPFEKISKMQKNVIEYYERYLSNENFIRKFESQDERIFTIMLHPRLVCAKSEEEQARKTYDDLHSKLGFHNNSQKINLEIKQ